MMMMMMMTTCPSVLSIFELLLKSVVLFALLRAPLAHLVLLLQSFIRLDACFGEVCHRHCETFLVLHSILFHQEDSTRQIAHLGFGISSFFLHLFQLDCLIEEILCANIIRRLCCLDFLLQAPHLIFEVIGRSVGGGHLLLPPLTPCLSVAGLGGKALHLLLD